MFDAIAYVEGVEIKALCDKRMVRVENSQKILSKHGLPPAKAYGGSEDTWTELCKDPDIDFISIAVPRGPLHAQMATFAMENGKHVAVEAPAASTLEEAWKLVETSERTKKHCMMLENCCYDFFELLTLNMIRQGFFGELIHADAGYLHHQNNFIKPEGGEHVACKRKSAPELQSLSFPWYWSDMPGNEYQQGRQIDSHDFNVIKRLYDGKMASRTCKNR